MQDQAFYTDTQEVSIYIWKFQIQTLLSTKKNWAVLDSVPRLTTFLLRVFTDACGKTKTNGFSYPSHILLLVQVHNSKVYIDSLCPAAL